MNATKTLFGKILGVEKYYITPRKSNAEKLRALKISEPEFYNKLMVKKIWKPRKTHNVNTKPCDLSGLDKALEKHAMDRKYLSIY
jgi:hypothetical protein